MLLTELDGFLTGLVVCPESILSGEWMTLVWGPDTDGIPPFEDPLDVQWFADAVAARRDEITRDLVRGKLQPILDVDQRNGEFLWEDWIDGFAEAVALRPEAWHALADDSAKASAWARLVTLMAVARDESDLDSVAINAIQDRAAAELSEAVQLLYAAFAHAAGEKPGALAQKAASKVGRNDPCPCGSGKKHKRCCG
ncbi:UPF0149 family protein [Sphingomonas sp. NBWT7]|uniref:UPF0149 family protein n=1 Tax=Sphingomonas sp. NBWT7 TaxID=2596913 RepID=UPI002155FFE2|nr:UPF0149 family protein [Sphingomonas sp. NBWT7]